MLLCETCSATKLNRYLPSPVFPSSMFLQIIDAMEKKTYKKDIDIIREGMDGTHMYILQQGSVNVTKVQYLPS